MGKENESLRRVSLAAFTDAGARLAASLAAGLAKTGRCEVCEVAAPEHIASANGLAVMGELASWTSEHFKADDALVFVGATGIAVRAIAPLVADKMSDPAVVCVDEKGTFTVPVLSGHVGGANSLAREVARICGGAAAISTATDVNGLFAVDEWARSQGLAIIERDIAKEISARLLAGKEVGFASELPVGGALPTGVVRGPAEVGFCVTNDMSRHPFERTLHLVPRDVTLGIGCRRDTNPDALERVVRDALVAAGVPLDAICQVATIDIKGDEPAIAQIAHKGGWPVRLFSAAELAAVPGDFSSSEFVLKTVGVDCVCERAAVAAGGALVARKRAESGVTVALARKPRSISFAGKASAEVHECSDGEGATTSKSGVLSVVGLGPGGGKDLTLRAREVLESCDLVVGYTVYVNLVKELLPHKETLVTPMRREVERCEAAIEEAAKGRHVAMVCSGDPGVYGMAGLCLELAAGRDDVRVEVVPGVTAANGGAAVLGAPLMHDFAVISLSDLLTPIEKIRARLDAAAASDMVICLYNPSSRKRADYLRRACDVMLAHKSPSTVCGIVRNIGREGEHCETMTLGELRDANVDMFTTVFVGNESTRVVDGRMVTPRGYLARKGQQ